MPPGTVPVYFFSPEAAYVASEFCAVVLFWAGFLRNSVRDGRLSERQYFAIGFLVIIFLCASKIIFTLPYTWIISIFAFGLGVLSAPEGQGLTKKSMLLVILFSVIILAYTAFILIGLAWFDFKPTYYYYYKILLEDKMWDKLNELFY